MANFFNGVLDLNVRRQIEPVTGTGSTNGEPVLGYYIGHGYTNQDLGTIGYTHSTNGGYTLEQIF